MKQRYGKWLADWRDASGVRKRKAFFTIEDALAWKNTHRRSNSRKLPEPERRTRRQRTIWRSAVICELRRIWCPTMTTNERRQIHHFIKHEGLHSTINAHELRQPTYRHIDRNGRPHLEKWETAEQLAERLQIQP
jgi:hypothetical protein